MQDQLETSLTDFLNRLLNSQSNELLRLGNVPSNLASSIRYSLLAPGKRIRPRLALACGTLLDLPRHVNMAVAASIEMAHCFTLIHDDLPCMDNDDFRRGKPSNHKVHGEAIALLAGDSLMTLAVNTFLEAYPHVHPDNFHAAMKRLIDSIGPRGVIGGQAQEFLVQKHPSLENLTEMHQRKTGALFNVALLLPKDLAGISDESPKGQAISHFANGLGLAFQTLDDLEDAPQDSKQDSAPPPTNILYYMNAEQACSKALRLLEHSTRSLLDIWKDKCQPLIDISSEIQAKLKW